MVMASIVRCGSVNHYKYNTVWKELWYQISGSSIVENYPLMEMNPGMVRS